MDFEQKKIRAFDGELSARLSSLPFTYVDKSLFWGEKISRRLNIFYVFFGLRAETILTFSEVFYALLSKLHLAYPGDHFDSFSEFFLDFEPFRDMSSKCGEFQLKNISTVSSKLPSSCADENFEQKLVVEIVLGLLSLLEFSQKNFRLLTESFRHGCPHCVLRM